MNERLPATVEEVFPEDWYDNRYLVFDDAYELFTQLNPADQEKVLNGNYKLFPTRDGSYPHFRWKKGNPEGKFPGTRAPGAGVSPAHVDRENGKQNSGLRNTRAYRDLLSYLLPPDLDPERRGSVGWLIEQALTAAEGEYVRVECPSCEHKFDAWRKPDSTILKELIHQTVGPAPKEVQHSGSTETIHRLIDERVDVGDVERISVHRQDPAEKARREAAIAEQRRVDAGVGNVIEGEYRDA